MTEHDALVATICADPDEDTPRLVYADFLEENGEAARAAFVRAQVELARIPSWEPFAVHCKWRRPEWATGKPYRASLPLVDGAQIEWHPEAFRRGLGWRVNARSLVAWESVAPSLLGRAPIGEMHLWGGTLDQWKTFAASPVVASLRKLHLTTSPIEPLRVLRDTSAARGITDIYFDRASGAGMPFVVEDLLESPLGEVVRGLHFHMGYEALEDLIDALAPAPALGRVSFAVMGLTDDLARRLLRLPSLRQAAELDLRGNPLGSHGLQEVLTHLPRGVHTLGLSNTGAAGPQFDLFATAPTVSSLKRLDLSRNPLTPRAARVLARSAVLSELRSLDLSRCRVGERELRHLARAKCWPNLVELDLRDNPIPPAGVKHLLRAEYPRDLTALVFSGDQIGIESRSELRNKFGEAAVFDSAG